MKPIYAYDDHQSGWGSKVVEIARGRGHSATLLARPETPEQAQQYADILELDGGYFFCRVDQFEPFHTPAKIYCKSISQMREINSVQTTEEIEHYERKDLQALDFAGWMPKSGIANTMEVAEQIIDTLGVDLVSKAAFGSSCSNVRILHTREECLEDARRSIEGRSCRRGTQKGYWYVQQFLPGNDYIYRVVRVGSQWTWMFRENNRKGQEMASGSGDYHPVLEPNSEQLDVLGAAEDFFTYAETRWMGIDLAKAPDGRWLVLETTLAWGLKHPRSSRACPVMNFMGDRHPKGYLGLDQFSLLIDEIEDGAFG